MALKVADSQDLLSNELRLFDNFPTNAGIEHTQWVEYRPLSQLNEDSPIEFNIPGTGSQYLDLKRCRLYIQAKIVKTDGSNITKDDKVGPVNLYLQSLWRQVDVEIQQQLLSSTGVSYPYKAMLDVMLNYGRDAKESQLETQLYYKDSPTYMDSTDPCSTENVGLFYRHKYSKESMLVDMEGPLYESVFQLDRYLLNGVDVRIKLHPSAQSFRLMADNNSYKSVITDAKIKVCKVAVSPDVMVAHANILKQIPAKYPFYKTEMKTYNISSGQYSFNLDNVFNGKIPTKISMVMVKSLAYAGSFGLNPYNFIHNNLDYLSVNIDGQSVPAKPLQPRFNTVGGQNYISAYQSLFSHMWNRNEGNDIQRSDFPSGYSVFVFDIEADIEENLQKRLPLIKNGNLKIEGHFEKPTEEAVTVILMAKFPAQFEVDETRSVVL